MLIALYSEPANLESLNLFTERFMQRFAQMQHDVDTRVATLGVDFVYLNNLEVGVQAASFWGNSYSNKLSDRNNASLALKYAF